MVGGGRGRRGKEKMEKGFVMDPIERHGEKVEWWRAGEGGG